MSYFAKFKTAINNPKEAIRYIISGSNFKFDESKYIPLYNSQKKYNFENSKYPIYFEFCKRILRDSISDQSLKKRFFQNSHSISESEMELVDTIDTANGILADSVSTIRSELVQNIPIGDILSALNFNGEITDETVDAARAVMFDYVFGNTDTETDPVTIDPDSFIGSFFQNVIEPADSAGQAVGEAITGLSA